MTPERIAEFRALFVNAGEDRNSPTAVINELLNELEAVTNYSGLKKSVKVGVWADGVVYSTEAELSKLARDKYEPFCEGEVEDIALVYKPSTEKWYIIGTVYDYDVDAVLLRNHKAVPIFDRKD